MKPIQKYFSLFGTLLGLFLPLLLGLIAGFNEKSFSRYYFTDAKIVFIIALTLISFSFVTLNKKWIIPAISLLTLTYFNCTDFALIHNLSAFVFFTHSTYLMITDKRFSWLGKLILFLLPLLIFSIYYFELVSVLIITIFHMLYLKLIFKDEKL
jgi:hypothetical protein